MGPSPGPRRFKTLSAAVRDGCARYPLPRPGSQDPAGGRFGRSAIHAAWVAEFEKDHPDGFLTADLEERYPELREDFGPFCPYGAGLQCRVWPTPHSRTLEVAIIHLEDTHRRSREQIAQWLEAHGW